jgi:hypothetical protein
LLKERRRRKLAIKLLLSSDQKTDSIARDERTLAGGEDDALTTKGDFREEDDLEMDCSGLPSSCLPDRRP